MKTNEKESVTVKICRPNGKGTAEAMYRTPECYNVIEEESIETELTDREIAEEQKGKAKHLDMILIEREKRKTGFWLGNGKLHETYWEIQ